MDDQDAAGESLLERLRKAIRLVGDELDADIILYSGAIFPPGDSQLTKLVRSFQSHKNVLLHMTTNGGDPDTAYRIARCLQRSYDKFIIFVDSFCKSAGTLIALGADGIIMSDDAEFGPLDVQLSKPDALAEQTSGLTPTHAITTLRDRAFESLEEIFLALRFRSGLQITTRTALEIGAELTKGLFGPIFAQIDPMRLGEISRAMLIANEYGERLARGNEKQGAISRLIEDYPSHSFVIDRQETEELFGNVRNPRESEAALAHILEPFVEEGQKAKEPLVELLSILIESGEHDAEAQATGQDAENCTGGADDERPIGSTEVQEGAGGVCDSGHGPRSASPGDSEGLIDQDDQDSQQASENQHPGPELEN